ncbi:MAG: tetratricopeptide repeat protein [Proteobacteria bacterium]|nr:tetratricopeptide repeat protein [Desulfobulbaceae bacterium]MBU4152747.1 tetratricopeptide repeat protein [Pseudomonadota bacterium]MDP2106274.1 tetratricopeptide repeat protein [Desulfobulbaceae bacterium]
MYRVILLIIVTAMSALFPAITLSAPHELINFKENTKLPSFTLPDIANGTQVSFNTATGKPSVLIFLSITPAFKEKRSLALAQVLSKLNTDFQGRVQCYGVSSDDQGKDTIKRYLQDKVITIPVLDDSKRNIYDRYGVFMMPLAILIGGDGTLQAVVPYTSNIDEILTNNLKFLLGDWTKEQWQNSFKLEQNISRSTEEKEYIRRVNYGRVMLGKKMHGAALREFMTALKIMPKAIDAYIGLGNVQHALGKLDQAEQSYRKALEIDKESDEALSGLGIVLYQKGSLDQAIPILEHALISPNPQLEVIVSLAEFYEKNGQIAKAIRLNKLAVSRLMDDLNN